ncbi:hypothetical protein Tco_1150362 [Tanacetum coccineum]
MVLNYQAIRLELIEVWFQFPVASPEQTATGKDTSNPFMAVMTCQKSYSSSTYYDSCSESGKWFQSSMDVTLSGSINLAAAVFVAVSILKALKTEDLSRKLEVNCVKFQFRGGLLGLKDLSRAETYKWYQSLERVSDEEYLMLLLLYHYNDFTVSNTTIYWTFTI